MAYAEYHADRPPERAVIVQTRWDERELIAQVPGFNWHGRDTEKYWAGPISWSSYVILGAIFGNNLTIGPELADWVKNDYETRVYPSMMLRGLTGWPAQWSRDGWPARMTGETGELFDFQDVDVLWLAVARSAALCNDMGTGKTVSMLALLKLLSQLHTTIPNGILPMVLVCPNGVKRHWFNRFPEWFPQANPYIVPNTGPVGRQKLLDQAREDPNAVVIINIEAVRLVSRLTGYGSIALKRCKVCDPRGGIETHVMGKEFLPLLDKNKNPVLDAGGVVVVSKDRKPLLNVDGTPVMKPLPASSCEVHPKPFQDFPFKMAVIDEAHRIRNPMSKSTRAVWATFENPSISRRIALTGTPLAQNMGDLWAVMHAVEPQEYPGKSKWLDRYALMTWDSGGGMNIAGVRPDRRDELFTILDPRFRRMPIDVVLPQLPPFVREIREVELTGTQLRQYREMEKGLVTRTESGELFVAVNHLVKQTRLQQLATGSVDIEKSDPDDVLTWKIKIRDPSPKVDELEIILDELGGAQCAVGVEHLPLVEMVCKRLDKLGITYGVISGQISELDRDRAVDALGTGRIRVLVFTLGAGGEGIDMSATNTLIRLQRSWKTIPNIQSERRIRRIGAERHSVLRIIDVVTVDTVEVDQLERLYVKLERIEEINRDRATRIAAGMSTADLDLELSHIESGRLDDPIGGGT